MDAMKHFSTRDAARILQSTEARIRTWARMGEVVPQSGPGGRLEFTFQQLLLLRTTRGLLEAGIPARRIRRVWSSLRRQLAADLPLTSIRILADGDRAIAWDGKAPWQPDSGQFLLDFDAAEIAKRAGENPAPSGLAIGGVAEAPGAPDVRPLVRSVTAETRAPDAEASTAVVEAPTVVAEEPTTGAGTPTLSAEQWFHLACELESTSPVEARQAYLQALEADPDFADAHVNLGRLDHEAGALGKAEAHYQSAVRCAPEDATGHFNLAVLLEDLGRPNDAIQAYKQAIACDPDRADAHYNLGLLLEARGRRPEAMRHLMTAHRLYALTGRGR